MHMYIIGAQLFFGLLTVFDLYIFQTLFIHLCAHLIKVMLLLRLLLLLLSCLLFFISILTGIIIAVSFYCL